LGSPELGKQASIIGLLQVSFNHVHPRDIIAQPVNAPSGSFMAAAKSRGSRLVAQHARQETGCCIRFLT
jgi:hypothetical protein